MKYKVGDKVKIKKDQNYYEVLEDLVQRANRIFTIKEVTQNDHYCDYYIFEGVKAYWHDYEIEGLVPEPEKFFELTTTDRFELMDFD